MSETSDNVAQPQFIWAGGQLAPSPPPGSMAELSSLLRELVAVNREVLETQRQHLELAKRWEQRTAEQQQLQNGEMTRLFREHPEFKGRSKDIEENVNRVLAKTLSDLFDYVENHGEDLTDSDYIRSDLVEKFGGLLYHLQGIHGIAKRISLFEAAQQKPPGT